MRSRRGGYVRMTCSHHPARLRGHPVRPVALHRDCRSPARRHAPRNPGSPSGRRGIHFVRRSKGGNGNRFFNEFVHSSKSWSRERLGTVAMIGKVRVRHCVCCGNTTLPVQGCYRTSFNSPGPAQLSAASRHALKVPDTIFPSANHINNSLQQPPPALRLRRGKGYPPARL